MINKKEKYRKAIINILGLQNEEDCKKIKETLSNMKDIEIIEINLDRKELTINLNTKKHKLKKIQKIINEIGFSVKNNHVTLTIGDMGCLGCTGVIRNSLKLLDGVVDVNIDFPTKRADIDYNQSLTNLKDMKDAVIKAGHQYIVNVEGDGLSKEEIKELIEPEKSSQCDMIF
jgi:copper chaperone CopZ